MSVEHFDKFLQTFSKLCSRSTSVFLIFMTSILSIIRRHIQLKTENNLINGCVQQVKNRTYSKKWKNSPVFRPIASFVTAIYPIITVSPHTAKLRNIHKEEKIWWPSIPLYCLIHIIVIIHRPLCIINAPYDTIGKLRIGVEFCVYQLRLSEAYSLSLLFWSRLLGQGLQCSYKPCARESPFNEQLIQDRFSLMQDVVPDCVAGCFGKNCLFW